MLWVSRCYSFLTQDTSQEQKSIRHQQKSRPSQIKEPTVPRSLVLVGRTGNGRSSTANSIMRRTRFTSAASAVSVTKLIDHDVCEFNDMLLHLLDGPGIGFVSTDGESARNRWMIEMGKAIGYCPEGVSAFLIVLNISNRFTPGDEYAIELLKSFFGPDVIKNYGIIVMTGGDTFERANKGVKFRTWCKEQTGPFKELLKECNNRIVLFNNAAKTGEVEDVQLQELLGLVDAIDRCRGKRYINRHFERTREARVQMYLEKISPVVSYEILKELSIVIQKLETIVNSELIDEAKIEGCKKLKLRVDTLERNKSVRGEGPEITDQLIAVTQLTLLRCIDDISERQRILSTYTEDNIRKDLQDNKLRTDELFERRLEEGEKRRVSRLQQQRDLYKNRCENLRGENLEKRNEFLASNANLETSLKAKVGDLFKTYLQAKHENDEQFLKTLAERHVLPLN